ncbi:MAG: hypothetical protein CMP26_13120 [Roseibacillus sp.]|nr:hypothetical protein [Roseibacillus sp.]
MAKDLSPNTEADSETLSLCPPLPPTRYHDLDALRAFAMLLGILLHAVLSFNQTPIWPAQDNFQDAKFQTINNSIHGFRMQLFFLVSGFFACMMWLKRGTLGLIWHRFKRILLPLFVFSLFIIPALTHMPKLAERKKEAALVQSKSREGTGKSTLSIWDAAKEGDLRRVEDLIAAGAKINRAKPGLIRATPLHHACATGETELISFLLNSGAKVDVGDSNGATPLHWAALMGQTESTRLLLKAGASPELQNKDGETPLQSANTSQDLTQMALWVLKMPLEIDSVMSGRSEVKALLRGESVGLWTKLGSFFNRNYLSQFFGSKIVLHHLWFLYDLFLLCVGFALLLGLARVLGRTTKAVAFKCTSRLDAGAFWARWKKPLQRAGTISSAALALLLILETYRSQEEMGTGEFGPQTAVFINAEPLPGIQVVSDDVIRTLRRKGLSEEALSALLDAGISRTAIEKARSAASDTGGRLTREAAEQLGSSSSLGVHTRMLWSHIGGLPSHLREEENTTWRSVPQYLSDNTLVSRIPLENIAFPPRPAWWKLWHYSIYFLVGAILFRFRRALNILRFTWPLLFALALMTFALALAETRKSAPEVINWLAAFLSPLGGLVGNFVDWFNGVDGESAKVRGWKLTNTSFLLTTYSWLMIFAFVGFFKLICSKPRKWIRFISNSSYWLYLAHMPLVDVLQIWVSDWGAGSDFWTRDNQWILISLKLSFVTVTSTALLLGSYFLIQYTPVSTLLNGKRKRLFSAKPASDAPSKSGSNRDHKDSDGEPMIRTDTN